MYNFFIKKQFVNTNTVALAVFMTVCFILGLCPCSASAEVLTIPIQSRLANVALGKPVTTKRTNTTTGVDAIVSNPYVTDGKLSVALNNRDNFPAGASGDDYLIIDLGASYFPQCLQVSVLTPSSAVNINLYAGINELELTAMGTLNTNNFTVNNGSNRLIEFDMFTQEPVRYIKLVVEGAVTVGEVRVYAPLDYTDGGGRTESLNLTNVALGRPVINEVPSFSGYSTSGITDGDRNSGWVSGAGAFEQAVIIDLGAYYNVRNIKLTVRDASVGVPERTMLDVFGSVSSDFISDSVKLGDIGMADPGGLGTVNMDVGIYNIIRYVKVIPKRRHLQFKDLVSHSNIEQPQYTPWMWGISELEVYADADLTYKPVKYETGSSLIDGIPNNALTNGNYTDSVAVGEALFKFSKSAQIAGVLIHPASSQDIMEDRRGYSFSLSSDDTDYKTVAQADVEDFPFKRASMHIFPNDHYFQYAKYVANASQNLSEITFFEKGAMVLTFNDTKFCDENKDEITNLKRDKLGAYSLVRNDTEESVTVTAVLVLYNEERRMIGRTINTYQIEQDGFAEINLLMTNPMGAGTPGGARLKLYLLDNVRGLRTFIDPIILQ